MDQYHRIRTYKGQLTRSPHHRPQLSTNGEQVNAAAAFGPQPAFRQALVLPLSIPSMRLQLFMASATSVMLKEQVCRTKHIDIATSHGLYSKSLCHFSRKSACSGNHVTAQLVQIAKKTSTVNLTMDFHNILGESSPPKKCGKSHCKTLIPASSRYKQCQSCRERQRGLSQRHRARQKAFEAACVLTGSKHAREIDQTSEARPPKRARPCEHEESTEDEDFFGFGTVVRISL